MNVEMEIKCPKSSICEYCNKNKDDDVWSFADGVYCINLFARDDKFNNMCDEFHRIGLCQRVIFYRTHKDEQNGRRGCWNSHKYIHSLANSRNQNTIIVFEDDAKLVCNIQRSISRIHNIINKDNWSILYLGCTPLFSFPIRVGVNYVKAHGLHAAIHNTNGEFSKTLQRSQFDGTPVDCLTFKFKCYAIYPSIFDVYINDSDTDDNHDGPNALQVMYWKNINLIQHLSLSFWTTTLSGLLVVLLK